MAKKFFYVCGGLLMLALAYHFGATTATAQAGTQPYGIASDGNYLYVMTLSGDVYARQVSCCSPSPVFVATPANHVGDFWSAGVAGAPNASWGQIKARYR